MRGARVFLNLAALRRGGTLTHVSGFLPELVALRSGDRFTAVVPQETADLVSGWGIETTAHTHPVGSPALRLTLDQGRTRLAARRADLLLSPLNHGPIRAAVPHLLWSCNTLYFRPAGSPQGVVNGWFARQAMQAADTVIYPTASIRTMAERSGVSAPGLILRHPLRTEVLRTGRRAVPSGVPPRLRVLVPSTSQPHKNLALLGRTSDELADRGIDHHFTVTDVLPDAITSATVSGGFRYERSAMSSLADDFDVVFIPSVTESYSYPLVEFELIGLPVAASNIDPHLELRAGAHLFDPASAHGAADALVAAVTADDVPPPRPEPDWRYHSPESYAASVSAEMDRLLARAR